MINNHELRRRIEEVKKDLKVLEKQVLELDYQIAPEVTGKAGEVTDVTKECQEHTLEDKLRAIGVWESTMQNALLVIHSHYSPLLQIEYQLGQTNGRNCVPIAYKNGQTDGRRQAIAEMEEKFDKIFNDADVIFIRIEHIRKMLFHPEEK